MHRIHRHHHTVHQVPTVVQRVYERYRMCIYVCCHVQYAGLNAVLSTVSAISLASIVALEYGYDNKDIMFYLLISVPIVVFIIVNRVSTAVSRKYTSFVADGDHIETSTVFKSVYEVELKTRFLRTCRKNQFKQASRKCVAIYDAALDAFPGTLSTDVTS